MRNIRLRRRRGATVVQWILIATVTTIVVIATVQQMGQETNTRLEGTSGGVGNPAALKNMVDP